MNCCNPVVEPRQKFYESALIKVIKTVVLEGTGVYPDAIRQVIYYNDPETGEELAKYDPCVGK